MFDITDFLGNPEIRISDNPKFEVLRMFRSPISEKSDFRAKPDSQMSGIADVQKSGFSEIREQEIELLEASNAGHRRCPDPTQKQYYLHWSIPALGVPH